MHAAVLIISRFSYGSKIRYDHRSLIFLLGCPQTLPTFSHTSTTLIINAGNVPRDKAVKIIESSHYYTYIQKLQSQGKKGQYMLHNYGKVHSVPHTNGKINYQLNFVADRSTKSVVMLSMVADDIKVVVHKSPGRIIEAYIEAFEALATTGDLIVIVQNIGTLTASYNVRINSHSHIEINHTSYIKFFFLL